MTDYYVDENERLEKKEIDSPSGRFKLLIRYYDTKKGCWMFSRGTIYRKSDGVEVCDIKRNYGVFNHSFVEKDGQEWLITGRSYMSQTIINLDTGQEYEPKGDQFDSMAFCWSSHKLSPDGNILVVEGCHWAAPYEFRFFDFSDPSKGWKELEMDKESYIPADHKWPEWLDNNTVICYESEEFYLPLNKF